MGKQARQRTIGGVSGDSLQSRFTSRLLLGTALASVAAGLAAPSAHAQDACGAPVDGVVTCSPADNPYPTGIEYYSPAADPALDPGLDPTAPVLDLTVNLEPGVRVQPGIGLPGVALIGFNDGAVTLNGGVDTAIEVSGTGAIGVLGLTNYGDLTINTDSIVATGRASAGINANSNAGDITITANTIAVTGDSSVGISTNSYRGDVTIHAGTISADGYYSGGIDAYAGSGGILITADSVSTTGSPYSYGSHAIEARAIYGSIDMDLGTVSTQSDFSYGISAVSFANGGGVEIDADTITTEGIGSLGALVQGATVNLSVGTLTTQGDGAYGAVIFSTGALGASFTSTGTVSTSGQGAVGVFARSYYGGPTSIEVNTVSTTGDGSTGLDGYSQIGNVTIIAASVTTQGDQATGVSALALNGNASVTVGDVSTSGYNAPAVYAVAATIDVTANGAVTTTGDLSTGIAAYGIYSVGVNNYGSVSTEGYNAHAIVATTLGSGDVTVFSPGSISTAGYGSIGILAEAGIGGDAIVSAGDIDTAGALSHGVYALGDNVSVAVDGAITTAGLLSAGVIAVAYAGTAEVVVDGSITTAGGGADGVFAYGAEGVSVTGTGAITTEGASAQGILAEGFAGDTVVDIGSVSTSGDFSEGIYAEASGNVSVTAGSVTTSGFLANGIVVDSLTLGGVQQVSDVTVDVGTVAVSGDYTHGIIATSSNIGTVSVNAGSVSTSGTSGIGILSLTTTADVDITAGTVTTTGAGDLYNGPVAIYAYSDTGNVSVTSTTLVSTQGDNAAGIYAGSGLGDVDVTVNDVTTAGDFSPAVYALGYNTSVTVNGDVTTLGDVSEGVVAIGFGGEASVANNGTISTSGIASTGIYAAAVYDVAVSGTGSVQTSGDGGVGIDALSLYGGITITAGTITTSGDYAQGVHAYAQGFAAGTDVTVNVGSVTTSGTLSDGIGALSLLGNVDVTSTGALSTSGDGAFGAYAFSLLGDATITVNDVTTTGNDAVGVQAYGYNASVTVNGDLSTSGTDGAFGFGAGGVQAIGSFGTAAVTINGSVSTSGDYATGVFARSYYGSSVTNSGAISTSGAFANGITAQSIYAPAVVVNSGSVTTTGDYSIGISARSYYGASVTNSGAISTSGTYSTGVIVEGGYDTGFVLNDGTIDTTGDSSAGILVSGYADVLVQGTGAVTTSGDFSAGIGATTSYGTSSITMASVSTTGEVSTAINAYGSQGATVSVGTVSTQGDNSLGVLAGSYGDVSVTAGAITTAGADSDAIRAATFGSGSRIRIDVGDATTTGEGSNAINALGFGGDVAVTLRGTVSSAQDTAVAILAGGDANVSVRFGASVTGAIDGISTDAAGTTTIRNVGTINTGSGYAISVLGGPAVITNAGVVNGRVQLSAGNDSFTNTGRFQATASSDFGAGNDVFNNSGTLLVDAAGTAPLAVSFTGLERFNNSGLVDLRNGTVGDQLTLPGAFVGLSGSRLGLDLTSTANGVMSADRLNVGTASGSTRIDLAVSGTIFTTPGLTLVQASAASSPTAFTLPGDLAEVGFVALDLVYNPTTFAYQLVGTPGSAVYRAGKALEGAQSLWYRSADTVAAHVTSLRDAQSPTSTSKGGFWLEMTGGVDKRDETRTVTNFGVTHSYDLDYKQDYYGGQAGYDFSGTGNVTFGITGGYMSSILRFDDASRFDYDAVNAGVYVGVMAGGLFANGLVKYDHYWIDAESNATGYSENMEGDSIGAQLEVGFRFGSAKFFAEPVVGLAYVSTSLDDLEALGQVIDYDRMDGLRGKAGLRLGGSTTIGAGNTLTFYASAMAVNEFKGDNGVTFLSGPNSFDIGNRPIDTYGQGTLGLNITTPSGITGFIEGTADVSKNYKGAGGRAGIKIPF